MKKTTVSFFFFCVIISIPMVFVEGQSQKNSIQNETKQKTLTPCSPNPDTLYNRQEVLNVFLTTLRQTRPEYEIGDRRFYIWAEKARGFFVYDLTEPSNKQVFSTECVDFKNNHVYHFAPTTLDYSSSNIAILEDGKLKIFTSINCKDSRDSLNNVVDYLQKKLAESKEKGDILDRVKNYRKYGTYYSIDSSKPLCEY